MMTASNNTSTVQIKDLKPGMNNLHLTFIVLEIGRPTTTKENQEVRTVKVADRSGMVNLSLWNEPGKVLQQGDIVRMTRGYTGMFKNCLTIYTAKHGEFLKIGDFCMIFSETPNMSEANPEMAAAFEKEESEKKAKMNERNNSRGGGQSLGNGGGPSNGGGGNKTWGSSGGGGDPRGDGG